MYAILNTYSGYSFSNKGAATLHKILFGIFNIILCIFFIIIRKRYKVLSQIFFLNAINYII